MARSGLTVREVEGFEATDETVILDSDRQAVSYLPQIVVPASPKLLTRAKPPTVPRPCGPWTASNHAVQVVVREGQGQPDNRAPRVHVPAGALRQRGAEIDDAVPGTRQRPEQRRVEPSRPKPGCVTQLTIRASGSRPASTRCDGRSQTMPMYCSPCQHAAAAKPDVSSVVIIRNGTKNPSPRSRESPRG